MHSAWHNYIFYCYTIIGIFLNKISYHVSEAVIVDEIHNFLVTCTFDK